MTHRIRIALAVALAAAGLSAALASPARAEGVDHRPCVSKREYRGVNFGAPRVDLERQWEVTGAGHASIYTATSHGVAVPLIQYLACGYAADEAMVLVMYQPRTSYRMRAGEMKVIGVVRTVAYEATLHGHE